MSLFNQLGDFGLNQLLAKRLTTPGPAPSPTVEPAIFPVLIVEGERPELAFFKGERLCTSYTSRGADAANVSQSCLFNPPGSNTVVTLERVIIVAPGSHGANFVTAALPTLGVTMPRDSRWPFPSLNTNTIATASTGINVAATTLNRFYQSNAGATLLQLPLDMILRPGVGVMFENFAVNQALGVQYFWRERTAQPGEL